MAIIDKGGRLGLRWEYWLYGVCRNDGLRMNNIILINVRGKRGGDWEDFVNGNQ